MLRKNTSVIDSLLLRIGLKKRKKAKEFRNYTVLVDSFRRKVYSQ